MTVPLFQSERDRYERDGVLVVRRDAFARDFPYKNGEHAVFGGPSTMGKTTLAFDLLTYISSPNCPAYVAMSKPGDPVTTQRSAELGYRPVTEWPPPPKMNEIEAFGGQKPSGYLVAPHFGDLNTDMERCAALTEKLIMERYAAGADQKRRKPGILVMDDTMVKAKLMHQDSNMVTILAMGGSLGLGMWIFVQKPTDSGRTPLWGYENATHLFFTRGGDRRMLMRYREVLGEWGPLAEQVIPKLRSYEFLYYHKNKNYLCIVGAKP
jgi:hypothetical protein